MALNQMQGAVQVAAGFLVYRNPIDAGLRKIGNELVRILDHEMAIQRNPGCLAERFYDHRPDREIGHEMPVHDIDMDYTSAAGHRALYLPGQVREIRRKYRGCQ